MAVNAPPALSWADPTYSQEVSNAGSTLSNTTAGLINQRGQTALQYGFQPTYDANGFVSSLTVDPNDPYSKAQLLQKTYRENRARNLNSFAQRGQLYSGALGKAQNEADFNFNQSNDALRNAFIGFIASNQSKIQGAQDQYNQTVTNAYGNALSRYTPPDVPDQSAAAAPSSQQSAFAQQYGHTLSFRGGSPTFIDSSGQFHQVKMGSNGYVYKTSNGTWAAVPGSVKVVS